MAVDIKDTNFINIQYWMVSKLNLAGNDLLVYAIIYGFSQDGKSSFDGGLSYLEKFTGCARNTVKNALKRLVDAGLIQRQVAERDGIQCDRYKSVKNRVKNCGGQNLTPSTTDPEGGQLTNKNDTPLYKEKINKGNKESEPKKFDPRKAFMSHGVSGQVAHDYILFRKQKRTSVTQTIFEDLCTQASLAGISLEEALRYSMMKNWQGFDASWYSNGRNKSQQPESMDSFLKRSAEQAERLKSLVFGDEA